MSSTKKFQLLIVNILTASRIVFAIIMFPIFFACGPKTIGCILVCLFLTDEVDGLLARKFHVSTFFGAILDSVSDKLMSIASCILLCFINPYMIYSIIIEVLIVIANVFIFTQKGNNQSSKLGKFKTWILAICVVLGFFVCKPSKHLVNILVASPAILFEFLTLFGYLKKLLNTRFKYSYKKPHYKSMKEIKMMLFNPKFYDENKDKQGLINYIYKNEKDI